MMIWEQYFFILLKNPFSEGTSYMCRKANRKSQVIPNLKNGRKSSDILSESALSAKCAHSALFQLTCISKLKNKPGKYSSFQFQ